MSKQTEIFEFADADLVRKLCGPNHANLALIEEAFGVYIEAPGAAVHINGDTPSRARAGELIKEIYQRLERGWPCGISDIRALIKAMGKGKVKAAAVDAIIPFPRRSPIVPKTPRQEKFIHAMRDARGEVARFIACRPAVEAGERLGFLPGDLNEKVDPYMQPIWDALHMVLGRDEVDRRRAAGDIEVAPLAFMRGRTLSDAFVVSWASLALLLLATQISKTSIATIAIKINQQMFSHFPMMGLRLYWATLYWRLRR